MGNYPAVVSVGYCSVDYIMHWMLLWLVNHCQNTDCKFDAVS